MPTLGSRHQAQAGKRLGIDDRGWRSAGLNRRTAALVGLAVITVVMAAYASSLTRLTLGELLDEREVLQAWVAAQPFLAGLSFVAVYVLVTSLAIPGAFVLSLFGGFLFGRWLGTLLVLVGATLAALIVFLVARSALGASLQRHAGPLGESLARHLRENVVEALLFLRLVPVFPFFLVNVVAAVFAVPVWVFLLTTAVGIAPAVFLYNSIGRQLGTMTSLDGLLSPGAVATLLALAALSLLPIAAKSWTKARPTSSPSEAGSDL